MDLGCAESRVSARSQAVSAVNLGDDLNQRRRRQPPSTPEQRGRAIRTWSGFTSITAAIGPVLGGWFVEHSSRRRVFFINLPLGLVVLLLALWKVPESKAGAQGQQPDWLGGLSAALGFGGIVFALIESAPAPGDGVRGDSNRVVRSYPKRNELS